MRLGLGLRPELGLGFAPLTVGHSSVVAASGHGGRCGLRRVELCGA